MSGHTVASLSVEVPGPICRPEMARALFEFLAYQKRLVAMPAFEIRRENGKRVAKLDELE